MLPLVYVTLLVAFGLAFFSSVLPYGLQKLLSFYAPPTIAHAPVPGTWLSSLITNEELIIGRSSRIIIRFILQHTSTLCVTTFILVTIFVCVLVRLFRAQRHVNWMLENAIYEERRFLEHVLEHTNPATSTPAAASQPKISPRNSLIKHLNIAEDPCASTDPTTLPYVTGLTLDASPSTPFSGQSELATSLTPNTAHRSSTIPSLVIIPSTSKKELLATSEAEMTYYQLSPAVSEYSNLMELTLALPSTMSSFSSEFAGQHAIPESTPNRSIFADLRLPSISQSLRSETDKESFKEHGADSVLFSADSTAVTISLDKPKNPAKFEESECEINATRLGDSTLALDDVLVPPGKEETNTWSTVDTRFHFVEHYDSECDLPTVGSLTGREMASEVYCSSARKSAL
jgi:hypothetical protein